VTVLEVNVGSVPYMNETVVDPLLAFIVPLRVALQPVIFEAGLATGVGAETGGARDLKLPTGEVNVPASFVALTLKK
jgi:hypothetical protein